MRFADLDLDERDAMKPSLQGVDAIIAGVKKSAYG
jgi:hypothetical protein